ncbi:MAG: D-amino acid aminotransferase [Burkholderiaceae bacterium]|jgi:D-alanine transaminase|nr:D-amino acid aminotransferase [Betaproteobacteria bacterium]
MSEQVVYLNGAFVPLSEARIPVLDRGFIFGDGIYEVVPVYDGRPFRLTQHLKRLERSLAAISIDNPFDEAGWRALIADLVGRHGWPNQFVYMQITRGVARRDHAFPKGIQPTVFAMTSEFVAPAAALREQGLSVITADDERWLHCDIKSVSLLGNVLAKQAAVDAGAAECMMFRDGILTEGSSSNIWVVRNGRVLGSPVNHLVLEGIRVGLLAELCARCGLDYELRRVPREEVLQADELMLTSATREILPITKVDGAPVGNGRPGPVYQRLIEAYQAATREA